MVPPEFCRRGIFLVLTIALLTQSGWGQRIGPLVLENQQRSKAAAVRPPSLRLSLPSPATATLPPLGPDDLQHLQTQRGQPPVIGVHRRLPPEAVTLSSSGETVMTTATGAWQSTAAGRLWRLRVTSPSARAMRIHFQDFAIGAGRLWLHSASGQIVGPYRDSGLYGDGDFWSGIVFSDSLTIEYLPDEAPATAAVPFQIIEISHIWDDAFGADVETASDSSDRRESEKRLLAGPIEVAVGTQSKPSRLAKAMPSVNRSTSLQPPRTKAATSLTPGESVEFRRGPVDSPTLFHGNASYRLEVPEDATFVTFTLESDANVALLVRYGEDNDLEDRKLVYDYGVDKVVVGTEEIFVTAQSDPPLRAGTYFVSVVVIATGVVAECTLTAKEYRGGGPLTHEQPSAFRLGPVDSPILLNGILSFRLEVPEDVSRVTFILESADPDVDMEMFVRHGEDNEVQDERVVFDYGSKDWIGITRRSDPPLQAGTYYVSVAVRTTGVVAEGTITATVETDAVDCHRDVTCYSDWSSSASGVAKIIYEKGSVSSTCSGTLLNNSRQDSTPYFLTAAHCVQTEDEARSVTALWFFQTRTCNGEPPNQEDLTQTVGADLLSTTGFTVDPNKPDNLIFQHNGDMTLLELKGELPVGVMFQGWDKDPQPVGTEATGIHHPGSEWGTFKRISFGNVIPDPGFGIPPEFADAYLSLSYPVGQGYTQAGSSGSAIFSSPGTVVGALSGGSDTGYGCPTGPKYSIYTRFSDFYPQIREYIDPVDPAPDLVVESPAVSDSSPLTGESFTLSATVKNEGRVGATESVDLHYYRSADATISAGDTEIGTDSVGSLDASETSDQSIMLTAPSSPGTYYYGACVDTVTDERDIGNNCSSAVNVTVRPRPDLVVESPAVSDSSPVAGQSFTLSATVRNQGAGATTGPVYLHYYLSADAMIGTSDTEVGSRDWVGRLEASQASDHSTVLTAPSTPGAYYYGACVDTATDESDTGNNCSRGVAVTVGAAPAPDLVVESAAVSESNPAAGESFTLNATVRNRGAGRSSFTTLRYYRSTDAAISAGDTEVGTDFVGFLDASETSEESIGLTAPSSPGTYYYGACADAVSDESDIENNCSSGVAVTVGAAPAPDLVVESAAVSESNPAAGETFTLSATVRNQGPGDATELVYLHYYQSADATISAGDTEIGTDSVGSLDASETSDQSIMLTAPSSPGTYYYGACVDTVTDERDIGNNCSSAVNVTVRPRPDLVVESPAVSDSSPVAGQSFTLSATVRNQGAGDATESVYLRYYQSADATIEIGDTGVGSRDYVGFLNASETSDEWVSLTAPSSPGTYYYGACVDTVTDESDTANNCSRGVAVTVGAAPAPDLVVESPTVSESNPAAGETFTLSATVRNRGAGDATESVYLHYYQSVDAPISPSDTEVGFRDSVGRLDASETSEESIVLTAPSSPGTYYYGACVDTVTDESDTGNNCSRGVAVTVGAAPAPDLVVESAAVSDSNPAAGETFTLSATVRNQGAGDATESVYLHYYQSADATIGTGDTEVGSDYVFSLDSSETSDEWVRLTAPSSPGTYYYGACVDTVTDESDTANNCSRGVAVTVGAAPAPDLVVESPTVSESNPAAGETFTLSATVRNRGAGDATESVYLHYYQSVDAPISPSDTEVGFRDSVGRLDASETSEESIVLTAPSSPGTYYYGACVDTVTDESDTGNNCSRGVAVTVGAAPAPDLVVESAAVSDSNPAAGETFTLSATVRNQGAGDATESVYLHYYQSGDATIGTGDTEVGSDYVFSLDSSETSDEWVRLTAPSSPGTYYYGACVDTVTDESDTANNCSRGVAVTVGAAPAPDLVVESAAVSDSNPAAGETFTLSATVRNQGAGDATESVYLRYYQSADATIEIGDTGVGSRDYVGFLDSSETSDEWVSLTAPSSPGTYYYGACVDTVTDESDTANNCSGGVAVTVGAAPAPDLVVESAAVSDSNPAAGETFTLSATVRNQGAGDATESVYLRYYQSADATIEIGDTGVGSRDYVGFLNASETSDEWVSLTAPSSPGTYYYGACVDTVTDESDTANNCSGGVAVTVGAAPAPDLVVESAAVSDSNPAAGETFTLSATVRNQGAGDATESVYLHYYQSADATIGTGDTEVGSDYVFSLDSSETSDEWVRLTAPSSPGTYYYGACVDTVTDESDTANNCSRGVAVTVGAAPAPDLVVESAAVSDSNPAAGETFTLSATVRNQGAGDATESVYLHYYQSVDATIGTSDTEVGSDYVGSLDASETSDEWVRLTAPSSPGTYYYGACVDTVTDESDTGNNCSRGVAVTVGAAPAPDLVVESAAVSDSNPAAGETFTLSATVRNQGAGDATESVYLHYYQSGDATIGTGDTEVGSDYVFSLDSSETSDEWVRLTAPSSPGTYYYGACVDTVTDESDTGNNCSRGVTVIVGIDEEFALEFAHFANGSSITSDMVLLNVATAPIGPTLYFFDQKGNRIGAESVVEMTPDLEVLEDGALSVRTEIEPLGELTISTQGRGALVVGSVRVVSDGPIGGVLRFDLPGIGVAGVGASDPVNNALFPARRQAGGINTGVALRNLETEEMTVSCYLMQGGSVLEDADIKLAADGQTARFIDEIFAGTNTSDFVGSVRCIAPDEGRFAGIALELDSGNGIFTTLPLVPMGQTGTENRETHLEFAHFANGSSITSDVVLLNATPHPTRPTLYFTDQEGNRIAAESVVEITPHLEVLEDGALSVRTEIEPLGELTISTHGQRDLVVGSVRVQSDGPIGGVLRFDLPGIGVAGVGASDPINDALFPARRQAGGINTGVALRNLETEEMTISCYLMRGGSVLEDADIKLESDGQTARFIDEIFAGTNTSDFVGSVRCIAPDEGRFAGIALELDSGNGIFTTLPVVPVTDGIGPEVPQMPPTVSLSASPASIERGQSATLTWSSTNAESASITPGIGMVPTSGSRSVSPTQTTTYRINVRSADGQTASAAATVTVTDEPKPAAPTVKPVTGDSSKLVVEFNDSFEAGETKAYDLQLRTKTPRGSWKEGGTTVTNESSGAVRATAILTITGLSPETTYEVRYRHRNSSRCGSGTPGEWSDIGEGRTAS